MRYRHDSTHIEHQQIRWTLFGFSILVLSFPLWLLIFGRFMEIPPGVPRLLANIFGWIFIQAMLVALPISIAIAILRYRLWAIDVIIRRPIYSGSRHLGAEMAASSCPGAFHALRWQSGGNCPSIIAALFTYGRIHRYRLAFYRCTTRATLESCCSLRDEVELEQLAALESYRKPAAGARRTLVTQSLRTEIGRIKTVRNDTRL
jgi:hypothetical protein